MDISKIKLGEIIEGLKCPKCKTKNEVKLVGLHPSKEKTHELECYDCFWSEKVNPKDVQFTYEEPKKKKKKNGRVEDEEYEEDVEVDNEE